MVKGSIVTQKDVSHMKKRIRIEYPYDFGLSFGNSDFVTIWLEFDLLVHTIIQSKGFKL